jgi:hypothetical protein
MPKKSPNDHYILVAYSIYKIKDAGMYFYAPKRVYLRKQSNTIQTVVVGIPSESESHAIRDAKKFARRECVPFVSVINRGDYLPPDSKLLGEKQNGKKTK